MTLGKFRNRSRILAASTSGSCNFNTVVQNQTAVASDETCADVIGNPNGMNPLTITKFENFPIVLNGGSGIGIGKVKCVEYPLFWFNSRHGHLTLPSFRDATQAIASTHPGKPAVSILNFLYELKDVPDMLRHAADRAHRLHNKMSKHHLHITQRKMPKLLAKYGVGEDFLNYYFGWLPFFSDLGSILELSEFTEQQKALQRKIKNRTLKTYGSLGIRESSTTQSGVVLQSYWKLINGTIRTETSGESWFTADWNVDLVRFGEALNGDTRIFLKNALGLDEPIPLILWEALPWSWFIDWFANVGSIIALKSNRRGIQFKRAVVMTKRDTNISVTLNTSVAPCSASSGIGRQTYSSKERTVFTPTFVRTDVGDNIFTPSHLAVLAALKVTKASRASSF